MQIEGPSRYGKVGEYTPPGYTRPESRKYGAGDKAGKFDTQKPCNVVFKKELLIKGRTEIHVEKGADLSMGDSLSCLVWLDESARRNYWDRVGQCAGWGDIVVVTR